MKLQELANLCTWEDVSMSFTKLYAEEKENLIGYEHIFYKMLDIKPKETKMRLCIDWMIYDDILKEPLEPKDHWAHVYGRDGVLNKDQDDFKYISDNSNLDDPNDFGNQEITWALEFLKWGEWADMEVKADNSNHTFSNEDIISHALYEMTFMGFTEDKIKDQKDELDKSKDDYEKWKAEGTLDDHYTTFKSVDELMKSIDEMEDEEDE